MNNTMLSKRSPKGVHGKTKRLSEQNYQYCNRYTTNSKRTKIETDENIPRNSKAHSNAIVQAATSGVTELNDSTFEHGRAKALQQELTNKNVKMIGNEAISSKLTAESAFLCSRKAGTSSHVMPRTISENRTGVSVSRETLHDLDKSDVLVNRFSQSVRSLEIADRHDFSSSGRKMGKDDSTARDRNKLNPINQDKTCRAALKKTFRDHRWESAVSQELHLSSPKRQNVHRAAGNFSEKKSMSERVLAKHHGKIVPEPAEAEQKIKKFASVTESKVSNLNLALDVARSPQSTDSSATLGHEHQQDSNSRDKVQKLLKEFKELFKELLKGRERNPRGKRQGTFRADLKAAKILRKRGKWINCYPRTGHVPGVNVGDRFQYRAELSIIGLHREYMCGINCEKIDGKICATSIVDSGRFYHNQKITADEFIYMGEGGNPGLSGKRKDQKLSGGNLALKNSMDSKTLVRVIRGGSDRWGSNTMGRNGFPFFYDGLFQVTNCKYRHDSDYGNKVFQFTMKRRTTDCPNLTQHTSSSSSGVIDDDDAKVLCSSVKNVNNKTSMFLYNSKAQCYNGGNRRSKYSSGIWNEDEGFDYEAGAAMAKPIGSNRRGYPSHTKSKLKLS